MFFILDALLGYLGGFQSLNSFRKPSLMVLLAKGADVNAEATLAERHSFRLQREFKLNLQKIVLERGADTNAKTQDDQQAQ